MKYWAALTLDEQFAYHRDVEARIRLSLLFLAVERAIKTSVGRA